MKLIIDAAVIVYRDASNTHISRVSTLLKDVAKRQSSEELRTYEKID